MIDLVMKLISSGSGQRVVGAVLNFITVEAVELMLRKKYPVYEDVIDNVFGQIKHRIDPSTKLHDLEHELELEDGDISRVTNQIIVALQNKSDANQLT